MRSHRLPVMLAPNPWARRLAERRALEGELLDLTESNPTRVGLGGAAEAELSALADPRGARYEPDPRGLASAREAVASYYGARGIQISAADVVLTAGTSESYAHLFRLLADPGDAILVPSPSYPLFEPIAALEGVSVVSYKLDYDGAWFVDQTSLELAFTTAGKRLRAVVVVQPNHPTGSCLSAGEVAWLETACEIRGAALISDEVFGDFPWPPRTALLPSLLGERRVPTFVLGGLSKCCGMPQLKLGWIVAAGPVPQRRELLDGLEWIADLFLSVGTPPQLALPWLLEARHAFRRRVRERLASNLAVLEGLTRERPVLSVLPAHGGWSAIVRLPARRSGEDWALALLERGVVAHPGHFYDLEGEAHLVLSLIPDPETFRRGLGRLSDLLTIP